VEAASGAAKAHRASRLTDRTRPDRHWGDEFELAGGIASRQLQRCRRDQHRQAGDSGHPFTQARPGEPAQPATALGPEDDDVGAPVLRCFGDPVGDGEAVGEVVDAVGDDSLPTQGPDGLVDDLHALPLCLGGVAASADQQLVDVDNPHA